MVIDIHIDANNSRVRFIEESQSGTKKTKVMDLDEFLQIYASMLKEKDDKYDFLYLLPGTVEYRKNLSSLTFVVELRPYKEHFGLKEEKQDFLVVIKSDLAVKNIISGKCYITEGSFNKHFSSFEKIIDVENIEINDEDDALNKMVELIKNSEKKPQSVKLRYKDII